VFRDSRGVVHTVTSADPLLDLPAAAADVLARSLLVPSEGDLGTLLERCETVVDLLERWQDAFFEGLPPEVDLEEEARWAEQAGLSLSEIEAQWDDDELDEDEGDLLDGDELPGQLPLADLDDLAALDDGVPAVASLPEEAVAELESALLLLPMRTRLEALVAATTLVHTWCDLMADHEKCLGHLVLAHGERVEAAPHEVLVDRHAIVHGGRAHHPRQP
jgi:hypothetical protein